MRFKTNVERLAHPQAKLIPQDLWDDYNTFNKELPDELLLLMQASDDGLSLLVQEALCRLQWFQIKKCAWLALVLSHPNLKPEKLISFDQQLSISDKVFSLAAAMDHLEVLRYLEEKAPDGLCDMIKAERYSAFQLAAANGHLEVLRYLEEKAPNELSYMIKANDYSAFRNAEVNGHFEVLRYLEEKAPNELCNMIKADNDSVFRWATKDVIQHLLSHATCFDYAEQHMQEYGRFVNRFVGEKINTLRTQKNELEQINPHAVFDIEDAATCKLLFYVLRNLIRRNNAALQDDILFLLNIPSVKALVHREVTLNEPNELLRLAVRMSNQGAASLLSNIPAVRELAEQNNYYQHEIWSQTTTLPVASRSLVFYRSYVRDYRSRITRFFSRAFQGGYSSKSTSGYQGHLG